MRMKIDKNLKIKYDNKSKGCKIKGRNKLNQRFIGKKIINKNTLG